MKGRMPGYDTYTGRWCKCGHREEDHSGEPGRRHECWSKEEIVAGFGEACSCCRFSPIAHKSTSAKDGE